MNNLIVPLIVIALLVAAAVVFWPRANKAVGKEIDKAEDKIGSTAKRLRRK